MYNGRLSLNAAHYLGLNTVDDCLSYCASVPDCVAFDFDSTSTSSAGCWLHMTVSDLFPNNTYNPSYDVDQYIIDRSCPTGRSVVCWSFRVSKIVQYFSTYIRVYTVAT